MKLPEILKLLNGLKVPKAPGPADLSARVLKECSSELALILAYIYNESLDQGIVPDDWRQENVTWYLKRVKNMTLQVIDRCR